MLTPSNHFSRCAPFPSAPKDKDLFPKDLSHIDSATLTEIKKLGLKPMGDLDTGMVEKIFSELKSYKKKAEEGDASAYLHIGQIYASDKAFAREPRRAMQALLTGAQKGSPECCFQIAYMFDQGLCVKQDPYFAQAWHEKGVMLQKLSAVALDDLVNITERHI